jgi:hypothetical protein
MAKNQVKQKQTKETLGKLDQAFAIDATVGEACCYANISESIYYDWVKDNPELSERFSRLRKKPVLKARQTTVQSLDDPKNAQWYLERKMKNEFGGAKEIISNNVLLINVHDPKAIAIAMEAEEELKKLEDAPKSDLPL